MNITNNNIKITGQLIENTKLDVLYRLKDEDLIIVGDIIENNNFIQLADGNIYIDEINES